MGSILEQNEGKNVLLVTLAAQGHINPLIRLGNRLASKGLHVTLATNDFALKHRSAAATSAAGVHLQFFSDGLPLHHDRFADMDYYINTLCKVGPINLSTLIRSNNRKFACVINTPFVPWAADVAAELGIPCAMLWIQPCTLFEIYHRYYNQIDEFPTESNPDVTVSLPGMPGFRTDELPTFVLPANTMVCFDMILKQVFRNMNKVKWVLGNSFMELEKDLMKSVNDAGRLIWPVGPLVPATVDGFDLFEGSDDNKCLEWLNKQRPASVVYISFGSLPFMPEKEKQSIAIGLKNTKRPVLWVIKPPENQENQELGFLEEIKDQGLIVGWSPQTAILSHPSIGCFLSHCGWNSLIESVTAGVPVIACPQWTDQPTNAKLVAEVWGVGVRLKKDADGVLRAEEVERCVEEIMSGPRSEELRKKAAELKTAAREAVADGGSSDKNIQMFVDEIMCT